MKPFLLISALFFSIILSLQAGIEVGQAAPFFDLKNIDGEMISPDDFPDAKGLIVIFTCNHCPFSVRYEDRIIAMDKKFKEMGYPVVAINPNDPVRQPKDSYKNMIVRAEEKEFSFPYLFDETQEIAAAYGATRTPHVFLLEKHNDGQLLCKYIGAIDDNSSNEKDVEEKYVEDAISAIENGNAPDPMLTKAIGCTIKWKEGN